MDLKSPLLSAADIHHNFKSRTSLVSLTNLTLVQRLRINVTDYSFGSLDRYVQMGARSDSA